MSKDEEEKAGDDVMNVSEPNNVDLNVEVSQNKDASEKTEVVVVKGANPNNVEEDNSHVSEFDKVRDGVIAIDPVEMNTYKVEENQGDSFASVTDVRIDNGETFKGALDDSEAVVSNINKVDGENKDSGEKGGNFPNEEEQENVNGVSSNACKPTTSEEIDEGVEKPMQIPGQDDLETVMDNAETDVAIIADVDINEEEEKELNFEGPKTVDQQDKFEEVTRWSVDNQQEEDSLTKEDSTEDGTNIAATNKESEASGSPFDKALTVGCYQPSNSNSKEVSDFTAMVLKENTHIVSVSKKKSPQKGFHALVSHDLNSMYNNKEGEVMKKHTCKST
ncbi:uncharacterized protein LOC132630629 [Lycium barbarum]|uniref:uncharacterized protein LOC132630629 n=1 Tax=Lycium barbarum TaxID=112863 RepID=UPI00293E54A5|nr:uncharacterized protein LOC132630629 [Lycium barbarum]